MVKQTGPLADQQSIPEASYTDTPLPFPNNELSTLYPSRPPPQPAPPHGETLTCVYEVVCTCLHLPSSLCLESIKGISSSDASISLLGVHSYEDGYRLNLLAPPPLKGAHPDPPTPPPTSRFPFKLTRKAHMIMYKVM